MKINKKKIIIATSKQWNPDLKNNIELALNASVMELNSKNELTVEKIKSFKPDYIFFPHWSYLIPKEIFNSCKCIVFHMTDLPFGRGGSPLQNLIEKGFKETKISALAVTEEIDAGDIYLKKPLPINGSAQEIYIRATHVIEKMIVHIVQSAIKPIPQEGKIVMFKRRKPEDGNIQKLDKLETVYDYIRMLDANDYPNAFIETEFLKIEFEKANFEKDSIKAAVIIKKRNHND